uniref:Cytochrome P450 n=1 Tax=Oryza nivara TaxID=4536 RepID=A0A0E0IQ62_ORYNI
MAELLQNPKSMIQLPEELKGLIGTKTHVAESDISQLPYLQAVIKETLRLHPTVPIAFNKAEATIWDDLDKFMPYRFLGRDINFLGTNFEFIPRDAACLHLMLASLLHRFEWTIPDEVKGDDLDMAEEFGLVLSMAKPLRAVAKET